MLRIIHHSNCFDGLASAALFWRFFRESIDAGREAEFVGTTYLNRQGVDPALFRRDPGSENAIVDFKYSADPRVTWWFDHHQPNSTFPTALERDHFAALRDSSRKFYDPASPSCARLIWRECAERFGWHAPDRLELVEWADRIDSGDFASAADAIELRNDAVRLGLAILHTHEQTFVTRLIEDLTVTPIAEILRLPYVAERLPAIERTHFETVGEVRAHYEMRGDVLFYDVADRPCDRVDRYIPYYLEPDVRYSVGISRTPGGVKVSVAYNPWSPSRQLHSIARVCELHGREVGGGGHDIIGGISLGADGYATAVEKARAVVETLNAPPSAETALTPGAGASTGV